MVNQVLILKIRRSPLRLPSPADRARHTQKVCTARYRENRKGDDQMVRMQSRFRRYSLAATLLWGLTGTAASAADPDALWKIVHGHCVPSESAGKGPAPCAEVDL